MKTARGESYTEVTHKYGITCALIWGGLMLASFQLYSGTVRLGELMLGMRVLDQSEDLSRTLLCSLLLLVFIRVLLQKNCLYLQKIIDFHRQQTRMFDPAVLAFHGVLETGEELMSNSHCHGSVPVNYKKNEET